jgi:hypothetical protein
VFEIIDRPRRIVLATTVSRPDRPSFDFAVEFTFEEQDGRTLMTVIQSGFPTAELATSTGAACRTRSPGSNAPSARASRPVAATEVGPTTEHRPGRRDKHRRRRSEPCYSANLHRHIRGAEEGHRGNAAERCAVTVVR